jgi:hypothetical protein
VPVIRTVVLSIFLLCQSTLAWPGTIAPAPAASSSATSELLILEREKFEYQRTLEGEKLAVERLKAWLTGGSILIPLLLGILTLAWQARTAAQLKDKDARDAFELKAAEIIFAGDNTRATKNKARALTVLFPGRFPPNFGDAFEPTQFGGPRFDAKLEVFKAACRKVESPEEVYKIWRDLFPGDNWVKVLLNEQKDEPPEAASAASAA